MRATSEQAFRVDLYREHLEEISFLHDQRAALLAKDELPWPALEAFEQRHEAHLDALVVGGSLALDTCRDGASDAGEWFGAVSLACRLEEASALYALLSRIDAGNVRVLASVADALTAELPQSWNGFVVNALARGKAHLAPALAKVVGSRQLDAATHLIERLDGQPSNALPLIEALGALRTRTADGALRRHVTHPAANVRASALEALALLPSSAALFADPGRVAEQGSWAHPMLGIAGGREAGSALRELARGADASPLTMQALGAHGDARSLQVLYRQLAVPKIAVAAAQSLTWITGAALEEERFVEEEVDEATLFANEIQAWRSYSERPRRRDGMPYGEVTRAAATDVPSWSDWLRDNLARFSDGTRYVGGEPATPQATLRAIAATGSTRTLRRLAALELEIRYACPVRIDTTATVRIQRQAIAAAAEWTAANQARFRPGAWYWHGETMAP